MVQWIAMKLGIMTHFEPVKLSVMDKNLILETKMADVRCPNKSVINILEVTEQGTAPVWSRFQQRCMLVQPGEYD